MSEVILVEYKAIVEGFKASMKGVTDDVRLLQAENDKLKKKLDDLFTKPEAGAKSLKAQLSELKAQLAVATDPKDIERLAKAAGKLTDQISSASKAANIFASESKFEQVGNAIGSVGMKLRNLDFKGAADQSKLLLSATKGITFKEGISGIKDLGTTLLNVGKSLLMNPIFLIGGAVIAIIANFDKLKNSGGVIGSLFTSIGKAVSFVTDGFYALSDAIGLTAFSLEAQSRKMLAELDKQIDYITKFYDKRIALDNAFGRDATENEKSKNRKLIIEANKGIQDLFKIQQASTKAVKIFDSESHTSRIEQQLVAGRRLTEEEQKKWDEYIKIINDSQNNIEIIDAKSGAKRLKDNQELNKKVIDEADLLARQLRDLQTGNIQSDYERKKKQILDNFDDETKAKKKQYDELRKLGIDKSEQEVESLKEIEIKKGKALTDLWQERENNYAKIQKDGRDKSIEIFKKGAEDMKAEDTTLSKAFINNQHEITEKTKQELADREQAERAVTQSLMQFVGDISSAINQINQNRIQSEIDGVNESYNNSVEKLDAELAKKVITQEQYNAKKKDLDEKAHEEERRLKREAWEAQKQASIISTLINTATAVVAQLANPTPYVGFVLAALAAATGAAQIAVIESQPTPKFAKGVVNLQGKGTGTSDEIPAMLSKGESVVIASETAKHGGLLKAMNKGLTAEFIKEFYITPALKAQKQKYDSERENSFTTSLMKSMSLNFKDHNLLDSLKQSRIKDKENILFLAKVIERNAGYNPRKW